jgi:hypothetical protein
LSHSSSYLVVQAILYAILLALCALSLPSHDPGGRMYPLLGSSSTLPSLLQLHLLVAIGQTLIAIIETTETHLHRHYSHVSSSEQTCYCLHLPPRPRHPPQNSVLPSPFSSPSSFSCRLPLEDLPLSVSGRLPAVVLLRFGLLYDGTRRA